MSADQGIVLIVLALFGVPTAYFLWNLTTTLSFNARVGLMGMRKPDARALGERSAYLVRFPVLPTPVESYERTHGRVSPHESPHGGSEAVLASFERDLVGSGDPMFFFGRRKGVLKDGSTSLLIGYRATALVRLYAWAEIRQRDNHWEWRLIFSETRLFRTPSEEGSHYEYSDRQHERYKTSKEEGAGLFIFVWDFVFSNVTTHSTAKRAAKFERRIKESFFEALRGTGAVSVGSPPRVRSSVGSGTSKGSPAEDVSTLRTRPPRRV